MTRTGAMFAAIAGLFVCSAAVAQPAVDTGVFAGADTLHVIVAGAGHRARDIGSPERIEALYQIVLNGYLHSLKPQEQQQIRKLREG